MMSEGAARPNLPTKKKGVHTLNFAFIQCQIVSCIFFLGTSPLYVFQAIFVQYFRALWIQLQYDTRRFVKAAA